MLGKIKQLTKFRRRNVWQLIYGSKWVAAGAIVFREDGRLLLIKHAWRGSWEYPVGMTDGVESPLETTQRELFEEAGLRPAGLRLLGVDFFHRRTPNGNLVLTFAATIGDAEAARLKLDPFEASDYRWATRAEALELVPRWLHGRLVELFKAYDAGSPVYLQGGKPVAE